MKETDRIWLLLAKKLTGEAKKEELAELQDLIREYPVAKHHLRLFSDICEPVKLKDSEEVEKDSEEAENAFARHLQRMKRLHVNFTSDSLNIPLPEEG